MAMGEPLASTACMGLAAGLFRPWAAESAPCVRTRDAKPLRASLEAQAALTTVSPLTDWIMAAAASALEVPSRFSKNLWAAEPSRTFIRTCSMPAATPETLPEYPCMGEATPFMFWDSRMVPSSLAAAVVETKAELNRGSPAASAPVMVTLSTDEMPEAVWVRSRPLPASSVCQSLTEELPLNVMSLSSREEPSPTSTTAFPLSSSVSPARVELSVRMMPLPLIS